MSLQPYELDVIKMQLGCTLTRVGAEPYIAFVALWDQVIFPYLYDNSTTSSTSVAAGSTAAITLTANPTAPNNVTQLVFAVGTSCVVDVGPAQEIAVIQILSALTATIVFANAHTAPYPIWPNGAEWAVRKILARIALIESNMSTIAPQAAGVQQADEVKLYASSKGNQRGATHDMLGSLVEQRMQARDDLSGAIGFPNLWRQKAGNSAPSRIELY
jgi:hypothetical protein